jgi:hypothetical protein
MVLYKEELKNLSCLLSSNQRKRKSTTYQFLTTPTTHDSTTPFLIPTSKQFILLSRSLYHAISIHKTDTPLNQPTPLVWSLSVVPISHKAHTIWPRGSVWVQKWGRVENTKKGGCKLAKSCEILVEWIIAYVEIQVEQEKETGFRTQLYWENEFGHRHGLL